MRFPLKKENANFLLVDEDEYDEGDGDEYEDLDGPDALAAILLVLILLDVEADLDERALLDADVEQVQDLVDVDVEDVAAQLVRLQLVPQAAEEEKEQALQVGREADYLQELQVVLPTLYATDRPLYPGLQRLPLGHDVCVNGN